MTVSDHFGADDVLLDLEPRNRRALLETLATEAASRCGCPSEPILDALLAREGLGSTALGRGIAMPHAQVQGAETPAILFARLRRPIDFEARDEEPVDLVLLLVWPAETRAGLLEAMGEIAQGLRDPVLPRRLRRAGGAAEIAALLNDAAARREGDDPAGG
jgi:PTS system nitrogen regulatory IIA component